IESLDRSRVVLPVVIDLAEVILRVRGKLRVREVGEILLEFGIRQVRLAGLQIAQCFGITLVCAHSFRRRYTLPAGWRSAGSTWTARAGWTGRSGRILHDLHLVLKIGYFRVHALQTRAQIGNGVFQRAYIVAHRFDAV